jgi:hypothetical protein
MANKTIAQMTDGSPAQSSDQVYILRAGSQDFSLTLAELAAFVGGGSMSASSTYKVIAAAGTNAANIKAAAGLVTGGFITNNASYPVFVKLFNKATAPVPGTDTPQDTFGVQAGTSVPIPVPSGGLTYSTGIAIAITKNMADSDATAVAANDCAVSVFYQ